MIIFDNIILEIVVLYDADIGFEHEYQQEVSSLCGSVKWGRELLHQNLYETECRQYKETCIVIANDQETLIPFTSSTWKQSASSLVSLFN